MAHALRTRNSSAQNNVFTFDIVQEFSAEEEDRERVQIFGRLVRLLSNPNFVFWAHSRNTRDNRQYFACRRRTNILSIICSSKTYFMLSLEVLSPWCSFIYLNEIKYSREVQGRTIMRTVFVSSKEKVNNGDKIVQLEQIDRHREVHVRIRC